MGITKRVEELKKNFNQLPDWEKRYQVIIQNGSKLKPKTPIEDKFLIKGCQSKVWIRPWAKDGRLFLEGDSDALISKGLIALLIEIYDGQKFEDIISSSDDFLKDLQILEHLSMNRTSGVLSMNKQIKLYAVTFNALS